MEKKGLIIVHTGDGKGKTTAALGMAMRAWGNGMRVLILQFIKEAEPTVNWRRSRHFIRCMSGLRFDKGALAFLSAETIGRNSIVRQRRSFSIRRRMKSNRECGI